MYPFKSGFQKCKERKQREQEEESLRKKKTIMKYFQPKSTQEDAEIGKTSEAVTQVTREFSEEETPSSMKPSIDIITEEATMSSAIQSDTDSEALVDDPLMSESIASEVCEHEKATGSSISTDLIPSNIARESPEIADYSKIVDWKDPAMWPDVIQDKGRERIVQSGLMMEEDLKQMAQSMTKDVDGRSFSEFLLYAKSPSGVREDFKGLA